jgi:hypothetical protein
LNCAALSGWMSDSCGRRVREPHGALGTRSGSRNNHAALGNLSGLGGTAIWAPSQRDRSGKVHICRVLIVGRGKGLRKLLPISAFAATAVHLTFIPHEYRPEETMIRLIAVAGFVLAVVTSAQAMTAGPIHQQNGVTQVAFGCGPGRTRVGGVCVARTTIRHARRQARRCARWHRGRCVRWF